MSQQVISVSPASFPGAAFASVRTRRLFAWVIDVCIVGLITGLLWSALLIGTLGLSLFFLPPMFPVIAVLYHAFSVSGARRGTLGMQAADIEIVTYESGGRASFVQACAQAILFYVSWGFPLVFLVTLVDSEKRLLHDLLTGLVAVRRPS